MFPVLHAALVIATSAPLLHESAVAASITRGPYLQVGSASTITVRWRTDVDMDSRVRFGSSPSQLNSSRENATVAKEHEITLEGLPQNTQLYYSVGSTTQVLASGSSYWFRTAPQAGAVTPTRIWVIGDSGMANQGARDVRDSYMAHALASGTDVWLMLGDNAYNSGTDSEYQNAVFNTYPALLRNFVLWPTRGNHEVLRSGSNNDYYEFFTMPDQAESGGMISGSEAYYSYDFANIHFICLDSEGSSRSPGSAMLQWLESDLAATPRPWIIAYWHHPPYTKGSHNSDDTSDSGARMRDMRQNVLPILEEGGVDLVLTGHSHSYERSFLIDGHYGSSSTFGSSMIVDAGDGDPSGDGAYQKPGVVRAPHEGAVYAVVGCSSKISGGSLDHPAMLTSQNRLGSLILDVNGQTLDAIFLDSGGVVRDRFRIVKTGATPADVACLVKPGDEFCLTTTPNPFSSRTTLGFALPGPAPVRLSIFDVAGRRITTLVDEVGQAGNRLVEWDGRDASGLLVPSGTYFVKLESGPERSSAKIVRLVGRRD